jgi:hypothetical protein
LPFDKAFYHNLLKLFHIAGLVTRSRMRILFPLIVEKGAAMREKALTPLSILILVVSQGGLLCSVKYGPKVGK